MCQIFAASGDVGHDSKGGVLDPPSSVLDTYFRFVGPFFRCVLALDFRFVGPFPAVLDTLHTSPHDPLEGSLRHSRRLLMMTECVERTQPMELSDKTEEDGGS